MSPITPMSPMSPMGPMSPMSPMSPITPMSPMGPMGPMSPMSPMRPMSCFSYSLIGRGSFVLGCHHLSQSRVEGGRVIGPIGHLLGESV